MELGCQIGSWRDYSSLLLGHVYRVTIYSSLLPEPFLIKQPKAGLAVSLSHTANVHKFHLINFSCYFRHRSFKKVIQTLSKRC
jgi:hypothetical protein